MKLNRRTIISILIVAFWLVMVYTLLNRYVFTDIPMTADTTLITPESLLQENVQYKEWMQLFAHHTPIGIFHTSLEPKKQKGITLYKGKMDFILSMGSTVPKVSIRGIVELNEHLVLQQLYVLARLLNVEWKIFAIVKNKEMLYLMQRDDESFVGTINMKSQPTLLDSASNLISRRFNLIPGVSYRISVFDPMWNFNAGEMVITVVGTENLIIDNEEVETYKLITTLGSLRIVSWVTRDGVTIKRTIGNQLEMVKIPARKAIVMFPELGQELEFPDINLDELSKSAEKQKKGKPWKPLSLITKLMGKKE
ncbi:hypothetical protein J7M23_06285 [Candidatus Sumerlaeota bacterium]|nr:hypothetical protein [Candidatus Sumerlaeota bacterium]